MKNTLKNSSLEYSKVFLWLFISSIWWFCSIINYYPNWKPDWLPMFWDWECISFSLFNFIIIFLLLLINDNIYSIYSEWVYIVKKPKDED